jgi:hypothetical protein
MLLSCEYRIVPVSEMPGLAAGMSRLMRLNSLPKSSNDKKLVAFVMCPLEAVEENGSRPWSGTIKNEKPPLAMRLRY